MVSPTGLPTEYNPSVSHRKLQKNYGIVPQSPTELPTDYNPSVSHRELQNKLQDCATFTDGFTDGVTDVHYRRNHRWITRIPKRTHV